MVEYEGHHLRGSATSWSHGQATVCPPTRLGQAGMPNCPCHHLLFSTKYEIEILNLTFLLFGLVFTEVIVYLGEGFGFNPSYLHEKLLFSTPVGKVGLVNSSLSSFVFGL